MADVREAMIVAGGAGTRLRPLTDTTPKPLLPFCGAPFLAGVLRRLAAVGVERVLLVVGADTAPFAVLREEADRHGVALETVPEPEPLDTAGGVRSALDRVTGTFLVLNGDILTDVDLQGAISAHVSAGADATLVLTRVDDPSTFGVCVRDGTRIVAFVEKPAPGELPGQNSINAGTYVLEPEALAAFAPGRLSFERDVFPGLVAAGAHVEGWVGDGVWADLGTPERFLEGHRLALDGGLVWPTLADVPADDRGVRRAPGVAVDRDAVVHGPSLLLAGARLERGAVVGPHTVVGRDAHVGAGARVAGSVLFDAVDVGAGAVVDGLVAGRAARVDEGAAVAPVTVVGDGATLGGGSDSGGRVRVPRVRAGPQRPGS